MSEVNWILGHPLDIERTEEFVVGWTKIPYTFGVRSVLSKNNSENVIEILKLTVKKNY